MNPTADYILENIYGYLPPPAERKKMLHLPWGIAGGRAPENPEFSFTLNDDVRAGEKALQDYYGGYPVATLQYTFDNRLTAIYILKEILAHFGEDFDLADHNHRVSQKLPLHIVVYIYVAG